MERQSILALLDFSPITLDVLDWADREAAQSGCELLLLHVAGANDPMRQRPPVLMTDVMDDWVRHCWRTPNNRIAALVREGDAVDEISTVASLYECGTICMGRGGTPEQAGRVARGVGRRFIGKTHFVKPERAEARPEGAYVSA